MSARTFLDTNVLLYADDFDSPSKRERAESLIKEVTDAQSGHVSMQVLLEYFSGATRKLRLSADLAAKRVEKYSQFEVVILNQPISSRPSISIGAINSPSGMRWSSAPRCSLTAKSSTAKTCRTAVASTTLTII